MILLFSDSSIEPDNFQQTCQDAISEILSVLHVFEVELQLLELTLAFRRQILDVKW